MSKPLPEKAYVQLLSEWHQLDFFQDQLAGTERHGTEIVTAIDRQMPLKLLKPKYS